jgi:hypothetical protein
MTRPPKIIAVTEEYTVLNYPPTTLPNGRVPREGGKFVPRVYTAGDTMENALSPEEFRREFGTSSECGSVIEQGPVGNFGTGNRRVYREGHQHDEDDGIDLLKVRSLILVGGGCCIVL